MADGNGADNVAAPCFEIASYPNFPPSSLMWQCRPSWNRSYELQHKRTRNRKAEEENGRVSMPPCLIYSFLNFRIEDDVKIGPELKKCASGGGGAVKSV